MGKENSAAAPQRRALRAERASLRVTATAVLVGLLVLVPLARAAPSSSNPKDEGIFKTGANVAAAETVPTSFQESVVLSGLTNPTALRFSPDGRVFVAEKSGLIKVFDGLSDPTPTIFADLRTNVHNFWDRGLLGMALDPNFPTVENVYVLYTYDAAIGGTAPRWGTPGTTSDGCPTPPGPTDQGCVVSGRLSRLTPNGNGVTETVLINDWCQQFPSHSVGSLAFGADGQLYASGGDGASFNYADYGQTGNPCGDPPSPASSLTSPTGEGGALRSQDLRTSADPTSLDGAILRLDPVTGAASSGNPVSGPDATARRIVAEGLRNPFRFTIRPGTNDLWIGDVGWNTWEEIDRIPSPTASLTNFGWPCYEGSGVQSSYSPLNICGGLPGSAVTAPYYTYNHSAQVVSGETCPTGSSSISGMAFYQGGSYPAAYNGALFFADHSRNCIWVMFPGTNGLPDPGNKATFVAGAAGPVDLQIGPGGDLFYVDYDGGTIRRIQYGAQPPPTCQTGQFQADYFSNRDLTGSSALTRCENAINNDWGQGGPGAPVPVDNFSARWTGTFTFPAGDTTFTATADDGIRVFVDGTLIVDHFVDQSATTYTATRTLTAGAHVVKVEYYEHLEDAVAKVSWAAAGANSPPTAVIDTPASALTWKVGDTISFTGHATDPEQGTLPASALSWTLAVEHCPSNCHEHIVQTFSGAGGSFVAPDHEYPSYLELRLTATDSGGLTNTTLVDLQPRTVQLSFQTSPSGLQLTVGSTASSAPFTRTVIEGSTNSISANSPQSLNGTTYAFSSWSDGGAQTHNVVASTNGTYTATYQATSSADLSLTKTPQTSGSTTTWTLAVRNQGPDTAQGVTVTDVLPARLVFGSASSDCTYTSSTRTVRCTATSLASGATLNFTFTTTLTGKGNGWVTNTAQVTSNTTDPNTANNSASGRVR
jgi:uncharacterized repeat protein (TIGR01451 family)